MAHHDSGTSNIPANIDRTQELRQKVEEKLRQLEIQPEFPPASSDVARLVHELQVHQLELEMQNEELRRSRIEIEESQARLVDLYNFAPIGYITVNETGTIVEANLTFTSLLGIPRTALLHQPFSRYIHPENQNTYYFHRQKLFSTGQPQICELQLLRPNAPAFWAHLEGSLARSNVDNKPVCRIAVSDISKQKEIEAKKEQLQELLAQERKIDSIGRLAGGVAHDYNNMLGVILGYTELALDKIHCGHPLYTDLQEIRKAAERSADLTRQLLAFARKQAIVPKILDLTTIIAGMLKMLRQLIGENIELNWHPANDLPLIKIDPSQIDQILVNLLVNARDAIRSTGSITISTRRFSCDAPYCATHQGLSIGNFAALSVSDNGCGMDSATLKDIFEPFFTTKGIGKGVGLGLATVYGIVKQNNGIITVASQLGQGATFDIFFPEFTSTMPYQDRPLSTTDSLLCHGKTLLVVEDEPALLAMTTRMLEQCGYTVFGVTTPQEATQLATMHAGKIDLLLTDVVMPGMNGQQLVDLLHVRHPELRHLFMSGYTADIINLHGVDDGNHYFIQKPFTKKELLGKIRHIFDQGFPEKDISVSS